MRQKAEEIEADIKSSCFICSIARDEFESNGIDYKTHIKDEHNMWKYAWLKFYLQEKDPLLFTGPEQFAFDQMKDKGTFLKLFPVKRSLSLNRMKARARSTESRVELQTLYDVLLSLEMSQKDFKKSITDVKRSQETQKDTTSNLQMKFARLQLLNTEALKESMASAKNELSRKEDSSFKYARETSAPTIVKKTVPGEDEHEF
jgi:inositol 1,4,5-triphosphate receptor type 1